MVENSLSSISLPGFFKFQTISDNPPLLTASDLTLGLARFELVFWFCNRLSEPNEENDRYSIISYFFWMEFSIVAESGIIKEACKAANHPAACSSMCKFMSISSSLMGFQIPDCFRYSPFVDSFRFKPRFGEIRNLVFDSLTGSQSQTRKTIVIL